MGRKNRRKRHNTDLDIKMAMGRNDVAASLEDFDWAGLGRSLADVINRSLEAVNVLCNKAFDALREFSKRIKDMSEEEFDELMKNDELTDDQKKILWSIRFSEKEGE